jgi:hypothetical protein
MAKRQAAKPKPQASSTPATYPDLPEDWKEILQSADSQLRTALDLLEGTFPYRYLQFDTISLGDKMDHLRDVDSTANPGVKVKVPSLRVFLWMNGGTAQIAAFFFLRLRSDERRRAYSLSLGIDESLTTEDEPDVILLNQLERICYYMKREDGVGTIDVVNQREIVEEVEDENQDDLADNDLSEVVRDAFFRAVDDDDVENNPPKLKRRGIITPGPPWPAKLERWEVINLTPY